MLLPHIENSCVMRFASGVLAAAASIGLVATPARADPCEAPLPTEAGAVFSGEVRYVGDGDSLCVGSTGDAEGSKCA